MAAEPIDVAVIGGGVIGLASAAAIAALGKSVVLIERHRRAGTETSTHNSGVIHAGLYYPPGSLKARLCVDGADRLYAFCAEAGVPADRCGKLVVAGDESGLSELERLRDLGTANGARELDIVDSSFVHAREPHVRAVAALWSPNSGRVEAEALVRAIQQRFEGMGGIVLNGAALVGADREGDRCVLQLEHEAIAAETVVNAAGLYADHVSSLLGGETFTIYPCRGEYAELKPSRAHMIGGLVYPLPHASGHGLGVHLTKTTGGTVLIGPTIKYQNDKSDYEGGREPLAAFVEPAQQILPEVTIGDLKYGGSGIRAKLHPPEQRFADFMIRPDAGQPWLIHAAGIDSPGLTASLAIGALVANFVAERH